MSGGGGGVWGGWGGVGVWGGWGGLGCGVGGGGWGGLWCFRSLHLHTSSLLRHMIILALEHILGWRTSLHVRMHAKYDLVLSILFFEVGGIVTQRCFCFKCRSKFWPVFLAKPFFGDVSLSVSFSTCMWVSALLSQCGFVTCLKTYVCNMYKSLSWGVEFVGFICR